MKKPNFFIVGAPKCGTTAMNDYLDRHPDIFMAHKELHYFGSDLDQTRKPDIDQYLVHFKKAGNEKVIGDASVWCLYSKRAAAEIKAFSPDAKILIMLRNPVEVIHSLHSEHLFNGDEDVQDFESALKLDDPRREGRHLPNSVGFSKIPPYRDSVKYAEMVQRYLQVFGSGKVLILLYDDFTKDIGAAVKRVLNFLEVDQRFETTFDLINPNKQIENFGLHRIMMKPSGFLKSAVRILIPRKQWRHLLMEKLFNKNLSYKKRTSMPAHLEKMLRDDLRDDVTRLETIIGRDLTAWK